MQRSAAGELHGERRMVNDHLERAAHAGLSESERAVRRNCEEFDVARGTDGPCAGFHWTCSDISPASACAFRRSCRPSTAAVAGRWRRPVLADRFHSRSAASGPPSPGTACTLADIARPRHETKSSRPEGHLARAQNTAACTQRTVGVPRIAAVALCRFVMACRNRRSAS